MLQQQMPQQQPQSIRGVYMVAYSKQHLSMGQQNKSVQSCTTAHPAFYQNQQQSAFRPAGILGRCTSQGD
jgi:hypothetical protein